MSQDPSSPPNEPDSETALATTDQAPPNPVPSSVGWSLIGVGAVMEIVPLLPGFLLFLVGASMLATRVPWCRRVDHWVARRYPKSYANSQAMNARFTNDFSRRFPEP